MQYQSIPQFETYLETLMAVPDGKRAISEFVRHHPGQPYGHLFNDCMYDVSADYIETAFEKPQVVLASKIDNRDITTFLQLLEMTSAVLLMTALHFRCKSKRHDLPKLKVKNNAEGLTNDLPLFVSIQDIHHIECREDNPARLAEAADEKLRILRIAESLNVLAAKVYRLVEEYKLEHGTIYGAFRHVACLAILDSQFRIVDLHLTAERPPQEPAANVVRQIRGLYLRVDTAIKETVTGA